MLYPNIWIAYTALITDKGMCFTADEFLKPCKLNGIKHITCSLCHLSSNGLAVQLSNHHSGNLLDYRRTVFTSS